MSKQINGVHMYKYIRVHSRIALIMYYIHINNEYIHTYVYINEEMSLHTYTHMYVFISIKMLVLLYIHTYIYVNSISIYIFLLTYIGMYVHTDNK